MVSVDSCAAIVVSCVVSVVRWYGKCGECGVLCGECSDKVW